jgi:beta-lactam-binding protein with PASTA domain
VHVPKVAGKPLAIAKRRIKTVHCRVGEVAFVRSEPKQRNLVLRTTPRAGKRLAIGAKVNLVVGRGR